MRMRAIGPRFAVIAVAGGMIAGIQLPALASPDATAKVTITAKSASPKVTGDVYVLYKGDEKYSTATISGAITGASTGEVAELLGKQWPYKSAWKRVGSPVTLTVSGASTSYSFAARPELATRYKVELLASAGSTTPQATSPTTPVYVLASGRLLHESKCPRPPSTCHLVIKFEEFVPRSALKAERAKRWYPYFAINYSRVRPKYLYLGADHGKATKGTKLTAGSFSVTVSWSFRTADLYYPGLNFCAKDSEPADGLNLPGRHGCGDKKIKNGDEYLG
jgi:hypothetical protein